MTRLRCLPILLLPALLCLACATTGQKIQEKLSLGLHDEALTLAKAFVRQRNPNRPLDTGDAEGIEAAVKANYERARQDDRPEAYRIFKNRVADLPGAQPYIGKADQAEAEALLRRAQQQKNPEVFQRLQQRIQELSLSGDVLERARQGEISAAYGQALKQGSTQALRDFKASYGDRLSEDLKAQVREEEAKLALFGDNSPKDPMAREALVRRFEGTEAASDARQQLLSDQLKLAQARGLPGLRAFIATQRRREDLKEWVAKAEVLETDLLREKAGLVAKPQELMGFIKACGAHELCSELIAEAETKVLSRYLKPVGISRQSHWQKSCWPKPSEAVIKKASSVFCVERKIAKKSPGSSFKDILYRARSQELRQVITLYIARRELDGLLVSKNKRRLEYFVAQHKGQPLTGALAKEAEEALKPKVAPAPVQLSQDQWIAKHLKGLADLVFGPMENETSLALEERERWQQAEADRLNRDLRGKMVSFQDVTVSDVVAEPKTGRYILEGVLIESGSIEGSELTVELRAVLPPTADATMIERGSSVPVRGRVKAFRFQVALDTLIIDLE